MSRPTAEAGPGATLDDAVPNRATAWGVTALLLVVLIINWADKGVLGLVAVPVMHDLHLSESQFGFVGSAFYFFYAITNILVSILCTRVQVRWVILTLALLWAVFQVPILVAASYPVLLISRIALGAAEGPGTPMVNYAAHNWFPDRKRTLPSVLLGAGPPLGLVIAAPTLTAIILAWGWQAAFATMAVVGVAWCVLWVIFGKEGPLSPAAPGRKAAVEPRAERPAPRTLLRLFARPTWWAAGIAGFSAYWAAGITATWLPAYFEKGLGFSLKQTGGIAAISPFLSVLAVAIFGLLSAWLVRRGVSTRWARGGLVGVVLLMGGACTAIGVTAGASAAGIVFVSWGIAINQSIFPLTMLIVSEIAPDARRSVSIGVHAALITLAGLIGPAVTGAIAQAGHGPAGYARAFMLVGVLMLVGGAAACLWIRPARDKAVLAAG